jgi:hypothetical protein
MPKTVPASKFQEWKGLDRISLIVHEEMKCIFRKLTEDDFGIDGEIEIVVPKPDGKGYQTTGSIIKVQSKSGMSYVTQDSSVSFSSPVSKDDLELWYKSNVPTIYIVYHPNDNKLYWKDVQSFVKNTINVWQPPYKILFDKQADEFTGKSFEKLSDAATNAPPTRISLAEREQLFSNLLPIKQLPSIWSAKTDQKSYAEARDQVRGAIAPFTIVGDTLYSLSDLANPHCVLKKIIDPTTVRTHRVQQFLQDHERKRTFTTLLNQLLGIHMERIGVRYNKDFKRNYFPREDQESLEFKQEWYNVRTKRKAPARITAKYYEYALDKFWRHLAADLSFKQIGATWFLQIIPKYFFTYDGIRPYDSIKVGPYTTQIKAMEHNPNVLNHVLFWTDALSRSGLHPIGKNEITFWLDGQPALIIEKMPLSGVANFAIPFDPAVYEEPEDSGQLSIFDLNEQEYGEDDEY